MAVATTSPSWLPRWLPETFRFSARLTQQLVGCNHGAVPAYGAPSATSEWIMEATPSS
jgi:hypothetical protein